MPTAVGLVTVSRAAARGYCRRSVTYVQNTVIVGAGERIMSRFGGPRRDSDTED